MDCIFFGFGRCRILLGSECSDHCKFRKTEQEFFDDDARASKILRKKGLKKVITDTKDGRMIVSTEEIT